MKKNSSFGQNSKNGSTSTKSSKNPNHSTNLFPSNIVSNYPSNNFTQHYLPIKIADEAKKKIMLIQNDKKEMGNNEMSKFHANYTPNMVVMQNPENIEKLNYQEEMPNNPNSTFYMNNQNDRQGQIKNIINYMNKMLQEQNMSHQIQMNKMLQEQNMSHQIQLNKHIQYIRKISKTKLSWSIMNLLQPKMNLLQPKISLKKSITK